MSKTLHPAKLLFKAMFELASQDSGPNLPTHFVKRNVFHSKCRKAGIEVPENFIAACQWENEIGLPEFVHKIFADYHKAHGTDFTPIEKAQFKLRRKMRKI